MVHKKNTFFGNLSIYIDVTKFCVFFVYHILHPISIQSDGVTYNTKQEAYKKLGRRYVDRYLNH